MLYKLFQADKLILKFFNILTTLISADAFTGSTIIDLHKDTNFFFEKSSVIHSCFLFVNNLCPFVAEKKL